jgi:acyl carrier protein phosphodiesterase
MNLLAHIYLSGTSEQVKVGNFIGDYVKGRGYRDYPPMIRKGILLHRTIDTFTDHSRVPGQVKKLLRPFYRKYAGIVVDVFYDHFLANSWENYCSVPLAEFVDDFYRILNANFDVLPVAVQDFVPRMIKHNRLYSYIRSEGIEKALDVMARYSSLPAQTPRAMDVLEKHYDLINENFQRFFPQMIRHVSGKYSLDIEYQKGME